MVLSNQPLPCIGKSICQLCEWWWIFFKVIPQSSGMLRCSPVLFRWKVETMRVLPQTQAHPRGPQGYDVYVLVCMSAVYPQRSGSSEHSLVREQHCEDLWFWPGQRHIQRPRLRQERQCMASLHIFMSGYCVDASKLILFHPHKTILKAIWGIMSSTAFTGSPAFEMDGSWEHLWQGVHQPEWCVVFWSSPLGNLFTG